MNTAILLCAVLLTANPAPTHVTARVLYGTDDESKKADIEPWISKAVAKTDSPIAVPQNGWIVLTGEEQRINTSTSGGLIMHGKVTERNGKYEVEINGCDGGPLRRVVTLKPGKRRVVKLTDYPAPNNVFIALAADAPAEESISVTVVGTLRTGIVALGGETTGTTITVKGVTWELDFGKNANLGEAAEKLDGKMVTVRGALERRAGVEVKDRWIVTVTELKAAEGDRIR